VPAALALLALIAGACDDPFRPRADLPNETLTFTLFALSGTPTNAPVGLSLSERSVTRISGALEFDLALDLNASGDIVVLPVGLVASSPVGTRLVGLQRVAGPFDGLTEAPRTGFVFDSTLTVQPGQVVAIQAQVAECSFSLTPYIFAKIVVDSVDTANRTLLGRTLINLNCGFRQLTPGLPTF